MLQNQQDTGDSIFNCSTNKIQKFTVCKRNLLPQVDSTFSMFQTTKPTHADNLFLSSFKAQKAGK
ncbi:hypothetical protein MANES_09G128450v8 [Manihot esculenta]|uniref:Uncharacterized protein n=1 Tax=Manihot esculenta TaxID=3983 RepID=A0ACB7H6S2_MANES|nr:hypothetical protein MANES_09G128450v8 [Manihot esculenta]